MRYRPLGRDGRAVSALCLSVPDGAMSRSEIQQLIYGGLEQGINCFEFSAAADPATTKAACEALGAVERELVIVGLRLGHEAGERGLSLQSLERALRLMLAECRLGWIDLITLEAPGRGEAILPLFQTLERLRDARRLRLLGVEGTGEDLDDHIDGGRFDLVAMPFTIASGWVERNRLRRAVAKEMVVAASRFMPPSLPAKRESGAAVSLKRMIGKAENPTYQAYDFLYRSADWTAEQICLAYALTEPSLATIRIATGKADHVQALAGVPDREMPNGVPAMIEMARFSAGADAKRA